MRYIKYTSTKSRLLMTVMKERDMIIFDFQFGKVGWTVVIDL